MACDGSGYLTSSEGKGRKEILEKPAVWTS